MIEKTNKTVPVSAEKPAVDASEALLFSILLTIIGGFFETYSYVARDHVFANGQTGNMARLGMNLAAGDFGGAFKYLIPIVCFALGVYFAEMVKTYCERHNLLHWKQAILLIEILLTVITALVPNEYNTAANVLIGVLCGLQMEAFRRLKTYAYNSTMCTDNLRSATEAFYRFFALRQPSEGSKATHYYGIIAIFILSAALGSITTEHFGNYAILFCVIPLCACLWILAQNRDTLR